MQKNITWLFFDVGSTLIDEQIAYKHRLQDIADPENNLIEIGSFNRPFENKQVLPGGVLA